MLCNHSMMFFLGYRNSGNITLVFKKGKKRNTRELQASQPYLCVHWDHRADIPGKYAKAHEEQRGGWWQSTRFTKSASCLQHLMVFYDGAAALISKGKASNVIQLDLYKAFDAVQHDILVSELEWYEFDGWMTQNWHSRVVFLRGQYWDRHYWTPLLKTGTASFQMTPCWKKRMTARGTLTGSSDGSMWTKTKYTWVRAPPNMNTGRTVCRHRAALQRILGYG